VNTSLAGFEALLRSKPVTTHGVPFYAGWGLTRDLGPVPCRRTATRSLDELVAAVLLLYPRYLDPVTGLPCPPEVLVHRIAEGAGARQGGAVVQLRRLQGRWKKRLAGLGAR
jgi:capsular polysaccharide export protein